MYVSIEVACIGIKHCTVLLQCKTEVGVGGWEDTILHVRQLVHPSHFFAHACTTSYRKLAIIECHWDPWCISQKATVGRLITPLSKGGQKKARSPTPNNFQHSHLATTQNIYWIIIHKKHAERTVQSLKLSKLSRTHSYKQTLKLQEIQNCIHLFH